MISIIFVAGVGTAYAGDILPMITFAANTLTTGTAQFNSDVNIDGILSGKTIDANIDDITRLQLMFFKIVVVANGGDSDISVLLGNGVGTFARTDVAVGNTPISVAIGKLNFLDISSTDAIYKTLSVCGGGGSTDLTIDSQCNTSFCAPNPTRFLTCAGACTSFLVPETCDNELLGFLVNPP